MNPHVNCTVSLLLAAVPLAASADQPEAIGVNRSGAAIPVVLANDFNDLSTNKVRVILIGGRDGKPTSTSAVNQVMEWVRSAPDASDLREKLSLSAIPSVYPDGSPAEPTISWPPKDGYYDHASNPESRYLWRWLGLSGADAVIEVQTATDADGSLAKALATNAVAEVGAIPAFVVGVADGSVELAITALRQLPRSQSPNRIELLRRQKRSLATVAEELAEEYGSNLKQVAYIPALGVLGRRRVADILQRPDLLQNVEATLLPFRDGRANPNPKSGSEQAGHLLFAEQAKTSTGTDRDRWIALCRAAADQIFDADGRPRPLMPFHNEMSDAFFMSTPIMAATGHLTGEERYFNAALGHFRGMQQLCGRPDGIYRHSPLAESAWGRGNGFAAVGTCWTLCEWPADQPGRDELLATHLRHLRALLPQQDATGMWHQVIDEPGSYREFTSTCMIGWALARGINQGWLDRAEFDPPLQQAWAAIKLRIGQQGRLVDVCTGTGKQKSLRAYYDRPAILGRDDRGGAMALLLVTELMAGN